MGVRLGESMQHRELRIIGLEFRAQPQPQANEEEIAIFPLDVTVPRVNTGPGMGRTLSVTVHTTHGDVTLRANMPAT